jgi:hypothetical protein
LTRKEMPLSATTMFLDASVLINVEADEFVVHFGIAERQTAGAASDAD